MTQPLDIYKKLSVCSMFLWLFLFVCLGGLLNLVWQMDGHCQCDVHFVFSLFVFLTGTNQSEILIDLVGLDNQSVAQSQQQPLTSSLSIPADLLCGSAASDSQSPSLGAPSASLSLLDEQLLSLGDLEYNVLDCFPLFVFIDMACFTRQSNSRFLM